MFYEIFCNSHIKCMNFNGTPRKFIILCVRTNLLETADEEICSSYCEHKCNKEQSYAITINFAQNLESWMHARHDLEGVTNMLYNFITEASKKKCLTLYRLYDLYYLKLLLSIVVLETRKLMLFTNSPWQPSNRKLKSDHMSSLQPRFPFRFFS